VLRRERKRASLGGWRRKDERERRERVRWGLVEGTWFEMREAKRGMRRETEGGR
jgi:hypothetical protein